MQVPDQDGADHCLSHHDPIRVPNKSLGFEYVKVQVIVDADGNVTSAEATAGPRELFEQAAALVRNWKYKPFEQDGKRVPAEFAEYVFVLPPEQLPERHVPFPDVHDWQTVKFTLERTRCYGRCPAYKVEVQGDGTVVYNGSFSVAVTGIQRDHISHGDVKRLLELFRAADYFSLRSEYRSRVTDNPTYITSISIDGNKKTVVDYCGNQIGMPQSVTDLEQGIDQILNTAKWVKGK